MCVDISHAKQDSRGGIKIYRLFNHLAGHRRFIDEGTVPPADDSDNPVGPDKLHCTVERVLEHSPRSDKSAVLLGAMRSEPSLGHRAETLAFTTGQDNCPSLLADRGGFSLAFHCSPP